MIDGVLVKQLTTFADDRGFFRELWRQDEHRGKIAQTSVTMTFPGVIKAFHYHRFQDDLWYVAQGTARVVLYDRRPNSKTYKDVQVIVCGQDFPVLITIPHGVAHGYQVLGLQPILLVYHTTKVYQRKNPDEGRIPFDDSEIAFDWSIKNR